MVLGRIAGKAGSETGWCTMTELSENYHYGVIERAIRYIDQRAPSQPTLDEVAAAVGLSPAHFQRVFSQWVGVSPKRYQQYLTLEFAKELLAQRHSVLDVSLSAGLSGSSRLHDLFVRWEAMSPGEYARAGAGLVIHTGVFETPFGPLVAMGTDRGICGMAFAGELGLEGAYSDLARRWPQADFRENPDAIRPWVDSAIGRQAEVALHLIGAPFQIKVWEALLQIPEGQVTTYSDIATAIGSPKAVRAVGSAVGKNPVGWLIPCHRALRKDGALGGYHWGLPIKRALLAYEAARTEFN